MNSTDCVNCQVAVYKTARFRLKDILPKYIIATLNLKRLDDEDRNMRLNNLFSGDSCRCKYCNPYTGN